MDTYERKYKMALERAKKEWANNLDNAYSNYRERLEIIFPELQESEDERTRKELIAFLRENHETGRADETWSLSGIERWIVWLEKQGNKPQGKTALEATHEEKKEHLTFDDTKWYTDNDYVKSIMDEVIEDLCKAMEEW